ncbi:MAG TPA: sugar kinase [Solirubrobacterales bacterium]|jgi:2-dehydro-3-deoxygluconokinase
MSGGEATGGRVVGLGEALVRLSPPGMGRLEVASELQLEVGGAELNALIAARRCGMEASWLTRIADNPLGRRVAAQARVHGVEARVQWVSGARAPVYFVEQGVDPRPTRVLYDRSHSAMVDLDAGHFDFATELEGADAVLCSGITCGLGAGPTRAVGDLFEAARAAGVRSFFDVNHRNFLWSWDEAAPVLREVLGGVDVLFASDFDLGRLLEREGEAEELAAAAIERFGLELVVLRENAHAGSGVTVSMTAVAADGAHRSESHAAQVVDGFGGGDAAVGVFVARLVAGDGLDLATDLAARACAFKHTLPGDAWVGGPEDLDNEHTRRILR